MAEVLGFIGVGGGVFDENAAAITFRKFTGFQQIFDISDGIPVQSGGFNGYIDKSLDHFDFFHIGMVLQNFCNSGGGSHGIAAEFGKPETVDGKISFHSGGTPFKRNTQIGGKFFKTGTEFFSQCRNKLITHIFLCIFVRSTI